MDEDQVRRERTEAKKLRKSPWWATKIARDPHCYYCGTSLTLKTATMDHIVPISRGGRSTKSNLVPSCKKCNQDKSDKTAFETLLDQL